MELMKQICKLVVMLLLTFTAGVQAQLVTYPESLNPGIPHNDDYTVRVRIPGGEWKDLFEYNVQVDMDNVQKASEAVARIIAAHILPCTLEFMDNMTINLVEDDVKIGLPRDAQAILLIEVDGHAGQVADEALIVEEQLKKSGATQIVVAKDAEEKNRIWEARRKALPALARFKPTTILEDATVPRSKIPAMMKVIKGLGEKYNLTVGTFGHAGDGNLHPTFMCDKRDKDEFERVERAVDELFNTTIEMGGTLSGEHGIGTAKQKWLEKETSRGTIGYSRRLRKAIDPKGLFNPSKLVGV